MCTLTEIFLMLTYICLNVLSYVSVTKNGVSFIVKGRLYEIRREGNNFYLITEDDTRYKIQNFNIDCDSVLIVSRDRLQLDWDFCEGGEL
jgi:hypothetical protein